jgi:hypothetical protein
MHEFGKFRLDLMSQSRHHTMSRTPVAVAPIVIGGPGSDFTWRRSQVHPGRPSGCS